MTLSKQQRGMLTDALQHWPSSVIVPYRKGASSTAWSLAQKGLVVMHNGVNGGKYITISEAGRSALDVPADARR